jgi:hypothetical protein
VTACGRATCLYHPSRIVHREVVYAAYAPRRRWQSLCSVVLVSGRSWCVKTMPVVRYACGASVKSGCQALLCIGLGSDGIHCQSLLLSAPCRIRYITPMRLWLSNIVAVTRAASSVTCTFRVPKLKRYSKHWDVVIDTTFGTFPHSVSHS